MTRIGPEDREPDGAEAEAQREATVMPWVWGAIGLLVVAAFAGWAVFMHPLSGPTPAPQHSPMDGPSSTHN